MRRDAFAAVRGFNYQPSGGSTSYENWQRFDAALWRRELGRGRQLFPGFTTVRLWLSWGAWRQDGARFLRNFEAALALCDDLGLAVVPCLFNRWHNAFCDNDGLYLDHFVEGGDAYIGDSFVPYVAAVVGAHAGDKRVLLWDMCNEPFACHKSLAQLGALGRAEADFLARLHAAARAAGATQPVGSSLSGNDLRNTLPLLEKISDVLLVHPYLMRQADARETEANKAAFCAELDWVREFARGTGKPVLVTETCWGSTDPVWRCENMAFTLGALQERGIGFLAHALYHSPVADLHAPAYGPILDDMGQFNFIEADGSLRPGHEVFNQYCGEVAT